MATRTNYRFRELQSYQFQEAELPEKFKAFFHSHIAPSLLPSLEGKRKHAQRLELAAQMVHSLITSTLAGVAVADTRDKRLPGVRIKCDTWDAIIDAGFARICLGSEQSRKVTRYYGTEKLLTLQKFWKLKMLYDTELKRNTAIEKPVHLALVVIHTGKIDLATGEPLSDSEQNQPICIRTQVRNHAQPGSDGKPDPRAVENGTKFWEGAEDLIEKINRSNLSHSWIAYMTDPETGRQRAFQPNVCLREVHCGKPFRAARLYSFGKLSGQSLSKDVRRTIQIDGEPVAELDFSGMATRMLYHQNHLEPSGDIYCPEAILPKCYHSKLIAQEQTVIRDFIKLSTNICWNTKSWAAARGAIIGAVKKSPQRKFLKHLLFNIEDCDFDDLLDRIVNAHPDLERHFFTGCGLRLMTTDGRIMKHILLAFADAGKPALGIHDSVVCRVSDVAFARETMTDSYLKFFRFEPVIKQVY